MASNTSIPIIVQGNSFALAIPLQIYVIDDNEMVLQDYTPDPTDEVSIQLKGSRRNYTYTPTIDGNVANINLGGYELADNYAVVVSIVKANGQRLRSFRTDQFFIVESSDDLTQDDIIAGLEENVIYLNAQAFIAGADGRGIQSILKTGTSGLVDTYTIYYTDNTTSTFNVTNGAQGAEGVGITSIEKTSTSGLVDTYTITLSNGNTSTFEVTNGKDGYDLGLASIINNLTIGGTTDALSAEMGKELAEMVTPRSSLSGKWRQGSLGTNHAHRSNMNNRIVMALPTSSPISFNVTSGYYASIAFYSTVYVDAILNTTGAGWISNDSVAWRDGDVYLEPPVGCKDYFIIIKKGSAGTDNISPSEGTTAITDIVENTPILDVLAEQEDRISDIEEGELNELFIGTLVQKGLSSNALVASDKYVSMQSKIVVPKEEATLRFKLPMRVSASVVSGARPDQLSHNNYWFYDGDTFTLPKGDNYFRLGFGMVGKNGDGTNVLLDNLTLADAEAYVNSGELKIYVDAEKPAQIAERNISSEKYVKAMMRPFVAGYANNGDLHSLPLLAHTSDTHGDANRLRNFAAYCDYLQVDGALLSGDMAALTVAADSAEYVNDIADECTTMILPCIGNHDARGLSTDEAQNALLSHLITKYELVTNSQVTYPTYFYKDISSKNIRIISLNIYENSHTNDNCHFSQQQCEWFIATLASTPANYGVLVMFHSPEVKPSKDNSYSAFYQDIINAEGYQSGLTGNVFRNIIDTFIERDTATISYTSKGTSISVSADFSSVASGVEFIAYANGHLHIDLVGYVPNARNLQLNLNVTTTNAAYAPTSYNGMANPSDLPRGCEGVTQDSFNIYAIDRVAKTVRIARVGSNVTGNLTERKYMVIPYAD